MDADDSIIIQFVASNVALPPPTAVAAAALAGSIGQTARAYASDRLFGALSGKSREAIIERIQRLIRARKLKCDHVGLSVVDVAGAGVSTPAAAAGVTLGPFPAKSRDSSSCSSDHALSGIKRSAAAAGLRRPDITPLARSLSATSMPILEKVRTSSAAPQTGLDDVDDLELSPEQQAVYDMVVRDGKSVFFTGSAGCGKSFLMRRIISGLKKKYAEAGLMDAVYVTAPTGIAACNVGGTTIHSFAGIGTNPTPFEDLVTSVERKSTTAAKRWKTCRTLVIDEISMLDGATFDILEQLACRLRKTDKAFGGIQLVLAGDFCQLPPVGLSNFKGTFKDKKEVHAALPTPAPITFCFEAKCWKRVVYAQVQLSQVFRQKDADFVNTLNELRVGVLSPKSIGILAKAGSEVENLENRMHIQPTKIFALNKDVERINNLELSKCSGPSEEFIAKDDGEDAFLEQLRRSCPASERLVLRIGAQVMLLKNIDAANQLVNGARGVVTEFRVNPDGSWPTKVPVVSFDMGSGVPPICMPITASEWSIELGNRVVATRTQIPLKLAYALSIHKSQGMTISSLEVSLDGVFEYGQAYVALSRAVSLDRLRVRGLRREVVKAHPRVIDFYAKLASAASAGRPNAAIQTNLTSALSRPSAPRAHPPPALPPGKASTTVPLEGIIDDAALASELFGDLEDFA